MIKKPDLRIDTEFFDDNLNGLHIPEAIRVTQSIDTQTFIKEGLSDEPIEGSTVLAVQAIERVISQRLFDNFVECWSRLKTIPDAPLRTESTPYSQRGHRRQSPLIHNQSNEGKHHPSNVDLRAFERQKAQFNNFKVHQQSGAIQWLEQQRKNIRSKSVLKGWSHGRVNPAETHYQRAKVLKEIVDKLKHGRQVVTGLIDQFDTRRENEQLHQKLNKLERLMEDVHYSTQRGTTIVSDKPSFSKSQTNRNPTQDIETELTNRLRQQLFEVKSEMEKIRRTNQQIIREQQWKKAEIMKMDSTHQEIKHQYETLKYQISYLQKEKQLNEMQNIRFQQEISIQKANRQQYERQISFLSQRLNAAEPKEREKVSKSTQRPIIPEQVNPFGYSTFTTSQKNSNALVNNWEQSIKPVQTLLPHPQINQQGIQSADEWACC